MANLKGDEILAKHILSDTGIVVKQNKTNFERPVIRIIKDRDGNNLQEEVRIRKENFEC